MQTNRHPNQGPTQKPKSSEQPFSAQEMEREKEIGVWRGSKKNLQYWLWTILTLSLHHWFVYRHNAITLSTRRVTQKRGNILTSSETSLSIDNITNVDVNMSLLGRIFDYGDISIQSAGSDATEIYFNRLGNPTRLRDIIFDLKDGKYDETKQ